MKHLRTTITSLFLVSSIVAMASGPGSTNLSNVILGDDSWQIGGVSPTELSQYGIKTVWYKRIEYGIKAGFNFTQNGSNPALFSNPLFGPVFGGTVALPINNWLGFRMELLYSQVAFEGKTSTIQYGPIADVNKLNYLDIPLMVRIKPLTDVDINLLGGCAFDVLLSSSYKYSEGSSNNPPAGITPNSTAFGYVFGIEYCIYEITAGFRFTGGMPDNGNLPTAKTMVGQFTLAYTFIHE
jgi:hypothetical protein